MITSPNSTSLLAADVGSVYTKVYLLDEVDGERRLVAVGRAPSGGEDGRPVAGAALEQALRDVMATVDRSVADAPERHILLTSLGATLRLAVVSHRPDLVLRLSTALEALPVRLLEPIAVDGAAGSAEFILGQLDAQSPDAVALVASDRPQDQVLVLAALEAIVRGSGAAAPALLVVGPADDDAFSQQVGALLAGPPALAHVFAAVADPRSIQHAARRLIDARMDAAWEAAGGPAHWRPNVGPRSASGPLASTVPTAPMAPITSTRAERPASSLEAVCHATEIIAERYDVDVLTLDLGAGHALATIASTATGPRRLLTVARDDLGLQWGRHAILREVGHAAIARWLPLDVDEAALRAAARRALVTPAGLPDSAEELLLEHAFAREALGLVAGRLPALLGRAGLSVPQIDLLIGSGGALAGVPRLMQAALIMLDAIQPEALTQLALDRATALPLIGRLASLHGAASLGAALERDGLLNLGLCVAPVGITREGELAIKVEVAYTNRSPVVVEVPYGAIEVVPLPVGERASLKLWPARDFDVGLGKGSAATPRAEVEGGAVGIIIDARGRPLVLPEAPEKRQAKLLQWLQATRAYPQLSFVQAQSPVERLGSEQF